MSPRKLCLIFVACLITFPAFAQSEQPVGQLALNDVSSLSFGNFSVTATCREIWGRDKFSFSIAQPMRNADRLTDDINTLPFEQNLSPSGRRTIFQAAYQKGLSDDIDLNVAVQYANQPDRQKNVASEASGLIRLIYRFN